MSWDHLDREVEELAKALKKEPATSKTAAALGEYQGRFKKSWRDGKSLTASHIPLPPPRPQALHPVGCQIEKALLSFQFELGDSDDFPKIADFQIQIEGVLYGSQDSFFELQDHWRVDTDRFVPSAADQAQSDDGAKRKPKPPREPHPRFHFQRGGHAQDRFAGAPDFMPSQHAIAPGPVWKGLLQTPGPRLPSLPFDPVLTIDFCVGQNDGNVHRRLRRSPEYSGLVRRAQGRLWQPFFERLAQRDFQNKWLGHDFLV